MLITKLELANKRPAGIDGFFFGRIGGRHARVDRLF